MDRTTNTAELFKMAFEKAMIQIPFQKEWGNGTGYYDNAVDGPAAPTSFAVGQIAKSESPNGRRLLFVGTPLGNIVVFDRYTDGDGYVFASNQSRKLTSTGMVQRGRVSFDTMLFIVGDHDQYFPSNNIGEQLKKIEEVFVENSTLFVGSPVPNMFDEYDALRVRECYDYIHDLGDDINEENIVGCFSILHSAICRYSKRCATPPNIVLVALRSVAKPLAYALLEKGHSVRIVE